MATKKAAPGTLTPTVARVLNCLPSRHPESDWGLEQATAAGVAAKAGPVPASVDLRASWWKINDQGSTGSCVGQATADALCRWHFVKAGRLAPSESLSIRYVWMAAKETDDFDNMPATFLEADGTSLKAALDVVRKYGVVTAAELPFTGGLYPGDPKTFFALAATRKITSYYRLAQSEWKTWLATTGPIMTRLDVDATWDNAAATHGNLDTYRGPGRGGHAVAIVGYTPTRFIVRNSWGTTWGDAGFGYASAAYAKKAFTESYGIRVG
jgi:C1A family cysteine protease